MNVHCKPLPLSAVSSVPLSNSNDRSCKTPICSWKCLTVADTPSLQRQLLDTPILLGPSVAEVPNMEEFDTLKALHGGVWAMKRVLKTFGVWFRSTCFTFSCFFGGEGPYYGSSHTFNDEFKLGNMVDDLSNIIQ